jgi:hypothetical protein
MNLLVLQQPHLFAYFVGKVNCPDPMIDAKGSANLPSSITRNPLPTRSLAETCAARKKTADFTLTTLHSITAFSLICVRSSQKIIAPRASVENP